MGWEVYEDELGEVCCEGTQYDKAGWWGSVMGATFLNPLPGHHPSHRDVVDPDWDSRYDFRLHRLQWRDWLDIIVINQIDSIQSISHLYRTSSSACFGCDRGNDQFRGRSNEWRLKNR